MRKMCILLEKKLLHFPQHFMYVKRRKAQCKKQAQLWHWFCEKKKRGIRKKKDPTNVIGRRPWKVLGSSRTIVAWSRTLALHRVTSDQYKY